MTKQELAHRGRLMYDLQEYCRFSDECQSCHMIDYWGCRTVDVGAIPQFWNITKADIERLERDE